MVFGAHNRTLAVLAATIVALLAPLWTSTARGQSNRNVLVVVNAASADSVRIGQYYAHKRAIPDEQVLKLTELKADPPDGIDRPVFEQVIQRPIAEWLARNQAQDRILYIVLTKGIPLRVNGGTDQSTAASVDSELAVLYLRMTGVEVKTAGPMPNPYFLGDRPIAEAKPFTHDAFSLYLVTRLDGFTVQDVIGVIDRGARPTRAGRFILDEKSSWTDVGNAWLRTAADRLRTAGLSPDRILLDESRAPVTNQSNVLGYYSWGSNDPAIRTRHFNLGFQPGAIGGMFVSTDGRTFREPPKQWTLPNWENRDGWFAGSPQSLAGDLIREGITGVAGHVAEPLLGNTIRPDILFPAYVAGYSLAEAYYMAMPSVSWMTVVIGDPLCSPFGDPSTRHLTEAPIDETTELPAHFSERRLAALAGSGVAPDVQRLLLRAEGRFARGQSAGARADLERATELAPTLLRAQLLLATLYESSGNYDAAIARYRTILQQAPDSVTALNNLAYALAVRKGSLGEARELIERARTLSPESGAVIDTEGWIYFMSGDVSRALPMLSEAVRLLPGDAEVRLHLAQALAASGDGARAREQLSRAIELNPAMRDRPDVVKAFKAR